MITRSLLTALAAGLLSVAAGASFAQAGDSYRGGPKTVVTHGTADRDLIGSWAGARGESDQIPEAFVSQNNHRYYGGPK